MIRFGPAGNSDAFYEEGHKHTVCLLYTSIETVLAAMGQMFYSMSLAMGIMVTYGSYMGKKENLEKSVKQIEYFDTRCV